MSPDSRSVVLLFLEPPIPLVVSPVCVALYRCVPCGNDLKELVLTIGGYRYVVFAIDEWIGSFLGRSRYSKGGGTTCSSARRSSPRQASSLTRKISTGPRPPNGTSPSPQLPGNFLLLALRRHRSGAVREENTRHYLGFLVNSETRHIISFHAFFSVSHSLLEVSISFFVKRFGHVIKGLLKNRQNFSRPPAPPPPPTPLRWPP